MQMKAENLAIDAIRDSSLSSLADIPHSMEFNLFKTLDGLITGWCESRALRPLYLLRVYPGILTRTHQQFQLLEALKNLKRLCRNYLTPEELRLVTQAHNFLEERLWTRIIWPSCCGQPLAPSNRRFEFDKRGQLFIRSHDVTLAIAAMRVSDPDRSPVVYR